MRSESSASCFPFIYIYAVAAVSLLIAAEGCVKEGLKRRVTHRTTLIKLTINNIYRLHLIFTF